MAYQFPPSSPLIGDLHQDDMKKPDNIVTNKFKTDEIQDCRGIDLSKQITDRGRLEYPTPNPSSCLFRSSSPVYDRSNKVGSTSINKDFNILNPDDQISRIPLNSDEIIIGRSSKSCDYYLNSKNKFISRKHVFIKKLDHENLMIKCLGYNGLTITLPQSCKIYQTNVENQYKIEKSSIPLNLPNSISKTIKLSDNYTGFIINRDESIILPKFNNILIDIHKSLILLNPIDLDEDLTDDELPSLITPLNSNSKIINPSTPIKETTNLKEINSINDNTPSKITNSINKKVSFQIFNDGSKSIPNSPKKHPNVLNDKSNVFNQILPKRKASSEEPPNKKKKKTNDQVSLSYASSDNSTTTDNDSQNDITDTKTISSIKPETVLSNISNINEISNILINHLAFSRLSSTPALTLKNISAITKTLSLKQIRVLLHNTPCIGIIYREGKDAAGKPLQEEYYYLPEKDFDEDRIKLVQQIKGHGGIRACRRTHKQYYWKKPAPIKK